jgi:hypothetical protein
MPSLHGRLHDFPGASVAAGHPHPTAFYQPPTGSLIQAGRIRFLRVDSINAKHRGGIHAAENLSDTQKLPVPA